MRGSDVHGAGALHGITVLDFTQVYLGPCCTQLLGDFGADVIKVERPGTGDLSRTSIPDTAGLDNPIYLSINRNKRSITVDLRSTAGKQVVLDLVRDADVVVSNFRSGVMERLGLGYDALNTINPRMIWASATGFGTRGPHSHKGGQDVVAQAYTGLMYRRASDDIPLNIYPTTVCDYTTGMHLLQGILLALFARERTGEGQRVDVAMYDSMLHAQMQEACMQLNRDREVNWAAMPLTGVFETADGAVCMVGAFMENPLRAISSALELDEDLSARTEFATHHAQVEHRSALQHVFRTRFATNTTAYWLKRLEAEDLLSAPVRTLAEALADEQTLVNHLVVEIANGAAGPIRALDAPIHLSATPAALRHAPPHLGEHGDEILREHGYGPERIAALRADGVVG